MENILLFVATVTFYSHIVFWLDWGRIGNGNWPQNWRPYAKRVGVVALLTLPLNVDGNVFTVAGNAVAEKNIYSVFSVYQKAGEKAFALISIGYQKTGQNAVVGAGLMGYQKAGQSAATIVGLVGYQEAGQDAVTLIGLAGYQRAEQNAITIIGLAGYQEAGHDAVVGMGLAGYQQAKMSAKVPVAIAFYQRVGEKTRAFGAFSTLFKD